jgi:hypothetical protein
MLQEKPPPYKAVPLGRVRLKHLPLQISLTMCDRIREAEGAERTRVKHLHGFNANAEPSFP